MNELEATNIFYVSNFNVIGGVETYIYELAKKYHQYDMVVVYKTGDKNQLKRLSELVRVHQYKGGLLKCKKFFCNYENDLVDKVEAEEYIQVVHALFITNKITPRINPKINRYLAVSNAAAKEFYELTGIKPEVCRNPLTIDKEPEVLYLLSATRLTREKGKERMRILAEELDKKGINYIWLVFTNDKEAIDNPNMIFITPRLNIRSVIKSIKGKGYGVQLSDCEGDCYFTRECEALGVPLIVTPIPSFKEQNLIEGKNCYYVPFDMKELNVERFLNIPSYEGYMVEDVYDKIIVKEKSNYEVENMKVKLKVVRSYFDIMFNKDLSLNEIIEVDKKRADELLNNPNNLVEFVEYVETEKKENKKIPTKKVKKAIK